MKPLYPTIVPNVYLILGDFYHIIILQYLTYLNPLRFFLVIANGVLLKNMDMYHVLINLTPLALIAVLTLSIAGWTFKSKLE